MSKEIRVLCVAIRFSPATGVPGKLSVSVPNVNTREIQVPGWDKPIEILAQAELAADNRRGADFPKDDPYRALYRIDRETYLVITTPTSGEGRGRGKIVGIPEAIVLSQNLPQSYINTIRMIMTPQELREDDDRSFAVSRESRELRRKRLQQDLELQYPLAKGTGEIELMVDRICP